MSKKFLKSAFFIIISVFIISCKTLPHENLRKNFLSENEELQWQKISEDFSIIDMRNSKNAETFLEFFSVKNTSKENPSFFLVKLNLENPSLKINIFPNEKQEIYTTLNVKKIAKKNSAKIAFNTTPFQIQNKLNLNSKAKPVGIIYANKKTISEPVEKYSALIFFKEQNGYSAEIIKNQNEIPKNIDSAAGGFFQILDEYKTIPYKEFFDTRTSIGISPNKKILFILAGKKLSYDNCAKLLKLCGAETAMEFDGGSSTHLVIQGKSIIKDFFHRNVPALITFEF